MYALVRKDNFFLNLILIKDVIINRYIYNIERNSLIKSGLY